MLKIRRYFLLLLLLAFVMPGEIQGQQTDQLPTLYVLLYKSEAHEELQIAIGQVDENRRNDIKKEAMRQLTDFNDRLKFLRLTNKPIFDKSLKIKHIKNFRTQGLILVIVFLQAIETGSDRIQRMGALHQEIWEDFCTPVSVAGKQVYKGAEAFHHVYENLKIIKKHREVSLLEEWIPIVLLTICQSQNQALCFMEKGEWPLQSPWTTVGPIFQEAVPIVFSDLAKSKVLQNGLSQWFIQNKIASHPLFLMALLPDLMLTLETQNQESPIFMGIVSYLEWIAALPQGKDYFLSLLKNGVEDSRPGYWYLVIILATELGKKEYDLRTLTTALQGKFLVVASLHADSPYVSFQSKLNEIKEKILQPLPISKEENIARYEGILTTLLPSLKKSSNIFREHLLCNIYELIGRWVVLCPDASRRDMFLQDIIFSLK